MGRDILTKDINVLLEIVREQSSIISSYEGKIPQIELDIIMSNIRRLYEDYYELSRVNRNNKTELVIDEQIEKQQPEKKPEDSVISKNQTEIAEKAILEKPNTEEKISNNETEIQNNNAKPQQKKEPIADLFAESDDSNIAQNLNKEKKTFYDKLIEEKKDKIIAETIQKPLKDLRSGIGVNDRFLFINELFKGNMQEYSSAIEKINSQADINDALAVFNTYKFEYQWKDNSNSSNLLLSFIKRRYL
jgi:hypothetical protein